MRLKVFIFLLSNIRTMATDISRGARREKVMLKPGFHLVDWMKLTQVSKDMRGDGPLRKISVAELAEHKSQFDCWTAYKGRVYNITQYIAYHPGGVKQLMVGAGKDCTVQFNKFHAWVNMDSMMSKCLIGVLLSEEETIKEEVEEEEEDEITAFVEPVPLRKVQTLSLGGGIASSSTRIETLDAESPSDPIIPSAFSNLEDVTIPARDNIDDYVAAALNALTVDNADDL
jgi:cytochrome b involved in lipid metabolism